MKVSYMVTTHNEKECLQKLLHILENQLKNHSQDELVILDDFSTEEKTLELLELIQKVPNTKVVKHKLEKDYSAHKNVGIQNCSGDYILAIDADEYPQQFLLDNIHELLNLNPNVELYHVPRVNIVHGVTKEFLEQFKWKATKLDGFNVPIINWPDYQTRLHKNIDNIRWTRVLHEHITGHKVETKLPLDPDYSLIHEKNIVQQIKQNERYMKNYTMEDNVRFL